MHVLTTVQQSKLLTVSPVEGFGVGFFLLHSLVTFKVGKKKAV